MSTLRAVLIVAGCAGAGAVLGGLIGWFNGVYFPGYYRALFARSSHLPDFDPIEVAVGMGIPQGTMVGIAVGLVLVAILAWFESRRNKFVLPTRGGSPVEEPSPFRLPVADPTQIRR